MPGEGDTYLLALRRELREWAPVDWQERVGALSGVVVRERASPDRMEIEADPASLELIRAELGGFLRIGPGARRERFESS